MTSFYLDGVVAIQSVKVFLSRLQLLTTRKARHNFHINIAYIGRYQIHITRGGQFNPLISISVFRPQVEITSLSKSFRTCRVRWKRLIFFLNATPLRFSIKWRTSAQRSRMKFLPKTAKYFLEIQEQLLCLIFF